MENASNDGNGNLHRLQNSDPRGTDLASPKNQARGRETDHKEAAGVSAQGVGGDHESEPRA